MTRKKMKKIRKLKKLIRNELNTADTYITLANIGVIVGSTPLNSSGTRNTVVQELTNSKEKLRNYLGEYEKYIDQAIELMS